MDAIEYVESIASETLEQARSAYEGMHERVHKFAALVAGGAGGAGIYALGKLGAASATFVAPLAALSCWWFLIAGVTLLRGAKSTSLTVGTNGDALRRRLLGHLQGHEDEAAALWSTRWDQVVSIDLQIEAFSEAASLRAKALDRAYWCVVCSPAVAGLAYLLAQ